MNLIDKIELALGCKGKKYQEIRSVIERMYDDVYNQVDPIEFIRYCTLDGKSEKYIRDELAVARQWIDEYRENEKKT